jgi:hypothetical protein
MDQATTLYRELAGLTDPAARPAQQVGTELYELIRDPDGANPFFAADQIAMHELTASQLAAGLGPDHRAVALLTGLVAAARANCGI